MKTQLVSAIHLQEVELQENASESKSRWFQSPVPPCCWCLAHELLQR